MSIDDRLIQADPAKHTVDVAMDENARQLARRIAASRSKQARFTPLMIAGVLGCIGLAGGAAAIAAPDLMPWARPYQGDLSYERVIPIETGALKCTISIGAEPDAMNRDDTTVARFEEAQQFLASIDIEELDRNTNESDSTWARARLNESQKPDPDESYINSTFVGQIQEEFEARGFLGAGIALQAQYGCEEQQ
ncbi:hypothetical protein LQ757_00015 [Agromyces sp. SYSU K20354]|uniref:hypothetical protein n=1 Tax=Agromyces cavernae TaxID=2898659 RepID=UPI001E4FDE20|nr:hypothetical protein [Agromyces cavernae]MCD2440652.1 hypothetical protein [Agromyces cavernae]